MTGSATFYARSVGCAELVEKPISSIELPAIIRHHLAPTDGTPPT